MVLPSVCTDDHSTELRGEGYQNSFEEREVSLGSRPREKAEAKTTVRILLLSCENGARKQLRNFSTLFAIFCSNCGLQSRQTSFEIHSGLIKEKYSSDFSSVHVFTGPGSRTAVSCTKTISPLILW